MQRGRRRFGGQPLVVGKGSKRKVKPGVWQYRHSPKRTIHTTKKREVDAAFEAYKVELNSGVYMRKAADTVGEYARRFHDNREGTVTPLAYKRERVDIDHIEEIFDKTKPQELLPFMVEDAYAKIRREGTYSENELHKIHAKLRQVMDRAVRDDLVAKNPCADIKVPRPGGKERQALSAEEAGRLLDVLLDSEPDAHVTGTLLMLDTGMRRGEEQG